MINFKNEVALIKEDLIEDIKKLCSIPSVQDDSTVGPMQPFGSTCREALDMMLSFAKRDGYKCHDEDGYAGHIDIGESNDMIGILGHVDVVPANFDGFDSDPFTVVIKDNKLVGRGVADDKGPLLAAYYAAKIVHKNTPNTLRKTRIIFGCNEEMGSSCVKHYFKKQPFPTCGFTPDAGFPVVYGEKAGCFAQYTGSIDCNTVISINAGQRVNVVPEICEFVLNGLKENYETSFNNYLSTNNLEGSIQNHLDNSTKFTILGKSAHASTPEFGVNAIVLACKYIHTICSNPLVDFIATKLDKSDASSAGLYHKGEMGELTLSIGIINYNDKNFSISIDMRAPHDMDFDNFKSVLNTFAIKYDFKVDLDVGKYLFVDQNSNLIKTLHSAYTLVTGDDSKPQAVGGGTYAKQMPNCVAFGPQFPHEDNHIHEDNESIDIDSLITSTEIYARAIYDLVTKKEV